MFHKNLKPPIHKIEKHFQVLFVLIFLFSLLGVQPAREVLAQTETKIAIITDYGVNISDSHKANIATLVTNWAPEAVVTAGDNYHDRAPTCSSYAACVAGYNNATAGYTDFVTSGHFYPSYGNHDAGHSTNYITYFSYLPSEPDPNHLYYDVEVGNIHFWVLNGNVNLTGSAQQTWLAANAPLSTAAWNVVIVHQAPYGTGYYKDLNATQIPYQDYGIDFVISGHNHHYERLVKDGIRYFIAGRAGITEDGRTCNGTGSVATTEFCAGTQNPPLDNFGYMQIVATETTISLKFLDESGTVRDTWEQTSEEPTDPAISVNPSSFSFISQPGVVSDIMSYTLSGTRLLGDITITPPADFEISTVGSAGFSPTNPIILSPTAETLADTTIYVRFKRLTAGTSTGNITHESTDATTREVVVSGTASETIDVDWVSYNDMSGTSTPINTTEFSLGITDGMLLDFGSGVETGVTVTVTSDGSPYNYTSGGEMPASDTDAYSVFNGKVDLQGVIMSATSDPVDYWVDVTFNDLDPSQTYTFAATANRAGTGTSDPPYEDRATRYTISKMDAAVNDSSDGVTVIDPTSVHFVTGTNTSTGYVAKWVNIQPGADGSFTVRAQPQDPSNPRTYTYGAFMLASEASANQPHIALSGSLTPFSTTPDVPSTSQSYTVTGANLTEDIAVSAPTGFEIATIMGGPYSTGLTLPAAGGMIYVRLTGTGGTFSDEITHTSDGAVTRTLVVSGTASDVPPAPPWTVFNDIVGSSTPANTTAFHLGTSNGILKDFNTGVDTNVTVDITSDGNPFEYTDGGEMPASGTDAYSVFNGKVDLQGVIMSATSNPTDYWVDVTFNDLDPSQTYTFAATANRAGTGTSDPPYEERATRYTISKMDAAVNDSSDGVTVIGPTSVYFVTGTNTSTGYVAKWVNIQPGADGSFTVRAQPQNSAEPRTYAYSAFMLQQEAVQQDTFSLAVSTIGNGSVTLNPSGGSYAVDTLVTLTPVAGAGYEFVSWSGDNYLDLVDQGNGSWTILMTEDKGLTANFTVITNRAPTDILLSSSSVMEGQAQGTVVGTLSAMDADAGDTHTFNLVVGAGDTDNASFTISGNKLLTAAIFDFETKSSYSIRVQVSDSSALTFAKAFTISILSSGVTPPLPSNFYGEIQYMADDDGPQVGHQVTAYLDDESTPIWSDDIEYYNNALVYAINVPAYTNGTHPTTVTFKIGGRVVAIANWVSGTNVELNLHPPMANAGGPYVGLVTAASVSLNGAVTDMGNDWHTTHWDSDEDGDFDDASVLNPIFSFSLAGTYAVSLKAVDQQGGEGYDTTQVFAITLSGLTGQVYNGNPHPITVTGIELPFTYNVLYGNPGAPTAPTAAGTYDILVQILSGTDVIATYTTQMVIAKATATITLASLSHTYDGTAKAASATTVPADLTVNIVYDPVGPLNAGSYAVTATIDDPNYTGSNSGTLEIAKATASVTLDNLEQIYNGTPKPVTATTDPPELAVIVTYDGSASAPSEPGSYTVVATVDNSNYQGSTSGILVISGLSHNIDLVAGWNLVSFNIIPTSSAVADVLESIAGKYSLVYGWDASSNSSNWLRFDPNVGYGNTLFELDETMGFWIYMNQEATLTVIGTQPNITEIGLSITAGGWNLIGFPALQSATLPDILSTIEDVYTLIFAYHATDTSDPWKVFDIDAPEWSNDLEEMAPGWGYWIFVTDNTSLTISYE